MGCTAWIAKLAALNIFTDFYGFLIILIDFYRFLLIFMEFVPKWLPVEFLMVLLPTFQSFWKSRNSRDFGFFGNHGTPDISEFLEITELPRFRICRNHEIPEISDFLEITGLPRFQSFLEITENMCCSHVQSFWKIVKNRRKS